MLRASTLKEETLREAAGHKAGTAAHEVCQRSCLPCQELTLSLGNAKDR